MLPIVVLPRAEAPAINDSYLFGHLFTIFDTMT